jgi:uncharacterized membrane protein HdeD (DUF308 family)
MSTKLLDIEAPKQPWWLVLLEGIVAIILGIVMLVYPDKSLVIVVQIFGIYLLIQGVLEFIKIFRDRSNWVWKLLAGIAGIIAGIFVLVNPLLSAALVPGLLSIVVGVAGIIVGIAGVVRAYKGEGIWIGILGVCIILLALILVANPVIGVATLPIALGIVAIVGGILLIAGAFSLR